MSKKKGTVSKTAQASTAKAPVVSTSIRTSEEQIQEIRTCLAAGLFIGSMDYIRALLESYDVARAALAAARGGVVQLHESWHEEHDMAVRLAERIKWLEAENNRLRNEVVSLQTHVPPNPPNTLPTIGQAVAASDAGSVPGLDSLD